MTEQELELFPTNEDAQKMLGYVNTGFYDRSYVAKWLFQVMGIEYSKARELVEELPLQTFPETATWGLMYHEIKWGLPIRDNLSYEDRRKLIYQKRDYRAPMIPYRMEQALAGATGFDVRVCDNHDVGPYGYEPGHPNVFRVVFIGEGTLDYETAKKNIEELKQSHTTYSMVDWSNIVFDNTDLEKIEAFRMIMNTAISFWGLPLLNGDGYLDGSLLLGGVGRYNLIPGIKYELGVAEVFEEMDAENIMMRTAIETIEKFARVSTAVFLWQIFHYDCLMLGGDVTLDGSVLLDVCRIEVNPTSTMRTLIKTEEAVENATIITTRNLAFLDGSLRMDGSRVLNSIYRKEAL